MQLLLQRQPSTPCATFGTLTIDGIFECYTLEPAQESGKGPIPQGLYNLAITHSTRFARPMPLLTNVEGFEGIRIHPGNTGDDTHGCILVGEHLGKYEITDSRLAFGILFQKIQNAILTGNKTTIEIRDETWLSKSIRTVESD